MTKNEEFARELLDISCKLNIWPSDLCNFVGIDIPELSDDECLSVSVNYPYSYDSIKCCFSKN